MEINPLSRKKTHSSSTYKDSNSCKVRVLLSSKREKRRIAKVEKIVTFIKQIKQETRITMAVMFIR